MTQLSAMKWLVGLTTRGIQGYVTNRLLAAQQHLIFELLGMTYSNLVMEVIYRSIKSSTVKKIEQEQSTKEIRRRIKEQEKKIEELLRLSA